MLIDPVPTSSLVSFDISDLLFEVGVVAVDLCNGDWLMLRWPPRVLFIVYV